jgi:hypothetical protein
MMPWVAERGGESGTTEKDSRRGMSGVPAMCISCGGTEEGSLRVVNRLPP